MSMMETAVFTIFKVDFIESAIVSYNIEHMPSMFSLLGFWKKMGGGEMV